jgi:2,4-didehydro-3-deoxy-L-rhamnonate hydrolase
VTALSLLEDWERSLPLLEAVLQRADGAPLATLTPLPPIYPPGAYLLASANYRRHVIEMRVANAVREGRDRAQAEAEATRAMDERAADGIPMVFVGWPGAVVGARDDVIIPDDGGVRHDWELELAVVIGRLAHRVPPDQAMDHVAGYTMSNDISTRDVMYRPNFPMTDFLMTKGRPGFYPTGPYIVPREFVADYRRLRLTLKLNGEVMQDEYVQDIIYGVEELVSYASSVTRLNPGDVLLTGSPGGNAGHHGNRWLRPGDVLTGEITGLGVMQNRCVTDPTRNETPPR